MSDLSMRVEEKEKPRYMSAVGLGLALFAVATSVTMAQYKIPTVMADIMVRFSCDAAMASWLMSIFTFVGIVVAVPTGFLIKRVGPERIVVAAVALNVVAALAGSLTSEVLFLLVTRALEGVSLVFVVAASPLIIQARVDPAKRGTATGIYMLGGMLGAMFAGVLTPTMYYGIGYEGLWVGYAVIVAAAGIVFLVCVRPAKSPRPSAGEGSAPAPSDGREASRGGLWRVFLKPNTLLFLVPFALFQMVLLTILSYAPTALQQQGMSPALSGLVSTLPMLLAVVSSIAFGALSDRWGCCKPLCIVGMLVLGPCCFVMLNFTGPFMWAALVIMGLLAMGTPTVFVSAYPEVLSRPELMSVGMGVLLLTQSLGQFLGTAVSSLLLGPAIDQWMLCGSVMLAAGLLGAVSVAVCRFR